MKLLIWLRMYSRVGIRNISSLNSGLVRNRALVCQNKHCNFFSRDKFIITKTRIKAGSCSFSKKYALSNSILQNVRECE